MKNISLALGAFPEIEESFGLIGKTFLEENWLYILLASVLIIFIAIILYYVFKPKPKFISAYEKAKTEINNLSETDYKESIFKLSGILKDFIAQLYNLPLLGVTSAEFIKITKQTDSIDAQIKEDLFKFLDLTDKIKYTGEVINKEQKDLILGIVLNILENSQKQKEDIK